MKEEEVRAFLASPVARRVSYLRTLSAVAVTGFVLLPWPLVGALLAERWGDVALACRFRALVWPWLVLGWMVVVIDLTGTVVVETLLLNVHIRSGYDRGFAVTTRLISRLPLVSLLVGDRRAQSASRDAGSHSG